MTRFLTILALWLLAWWSVVGALLAPVLPGGYATVLALAVATTLPLPIIAGGRQAGRTPGAGERRFLLRGFVYVQLLLPLAGIAGLLGALGGAAFGVAGVAGRGAMAVVAVLYLVFAIVGYVDSRRIALTRVTAWWDDLPAGLDGLRIAQISDTHIGPQTSRRYLAEVVRLTQESAPDLIVVTGDLIDDHAADVDHFAAALGALSAPLGVYAIAGNHDIYAGWPAVRTRLAALPITVLVNESRVIRRGGSELVLAGTGDPAARRLPEGGPDIDRTLAGVPPGAFVVALAHNPALWPPLAKHGVRLTLSGHTHWGQLAIPRLGWSLASPFNTFAMGGYRDGASMLYVHPGTNYWGIPFRLGTPPEVALVTLRRGSPT